MPIVIRELIIRATAEQGAGGTEPDLAEPKPKEANRQELVTEVVDQVFDILRAKEER